MRSATISMRNEPGNGANLRAFECPDRSLPIGSHGFVAMSNIHDEIYDHVCSLLTGDVIANLRSMLHSAMDIRDLASFCADRDKLSMIDYRRLADGSGAVREFRSTIFSVRLRITVETDAADKTIKNVQFRAEIQDGNASALQILLPGTASNCST